MLHNILANITSSAYLNTLNPYLVRFSDNFGIRWYGFAYLMGFLAAYLIVRGLAKKNSICLRVDQAGDFIFAAALGAVLGGRLGYCIFYEPELFSRFTSALPYWGVLEIHKGGMASHGGIIGLVIGCYIFAHKRGLSTLALVDLVALTSGIGVFFGRVANFINGELIGRPCSPSLPWAVQFPQELFLWPKDMPAKLFDLAPLVEKLRLLPQSQWRALIEKTPADEHVYGVLQRIVEAVQAKSLIAQTDLSILLTPRHPSQLYEALLEGLLLFGFLWLVRYFSKKDGVVTFACALFYPAVRVLGEQFRLPDPAIGFQWLGLTRGQWLSIAMVALALVCAYNVRRRNLDPKL